jgi:putative intracellular protease/amidase
MKLNLGAIISKIIALLGGFGALAVLAVEPVQQFLVAFIAANPKLAPIAGFLALVFAAFLPKPTTSSTR